MANHKYIDVKADLLSKIILGVFPPGTILPSERELTLLFGMSRISIQHAIHCLQEEGYLRKGPQGEAILECGNVNASNPHLAFISTVPNYFAQDLYRKIFVALSMKCFMRNIPLYFLNMATKTSTLPKQSFDAAFVAGYKVFPKPPLNSKRLVYIDNITPPPAFASVSTDYYAAGKLAAAKMYEYGYRNPAMLYVHESRSPAFIERERGFRDGCDEYGLELHEMASSSTMLKSIYFALLKMPENIDAIFVTYDYFAINAIMALKRMGRRVPDDIAIIGFDGLDASAFLNPSLATLEHPVDAIASKAIELAMAEEEPSGIHLFKPCFKDGASFPLHVK